MRIRTLIVPLTMVLAAVSGLAGAAAQEQTTETGGDAQRGQRPRLALEPAAGPPGSAVAAMGSGFRGACGVRLYFDAATDIPLSSADVDSSGAFSARLVIPARAAGGRHAVLARALKPGAEGCAAPADDRAQATFEVTPGGKTPPSLVIETRDARPGATVRVEGRGFCGEAACSAVRILVDGQVGAGDVKVNPAGTFSAAARVPAINTVGRIAVTAVQTLADQSEIRAFGEIEVTPRPNVRRQPAE